MQKDAHDSLIMVSVYNQQQSLSRQGMMTEQKNTKHLNELNRTEGYLDKSNCTIHPSYYITYICLILYIITWFLEIVIPLSGQDMKHAKSG